MNVVWRCSVCHRKKELNGKHLENKTEVRSDCWPCGKKRTFLREINEDIETSANELATLDTSNSFANDAVAATGVAAAALTCHSVPTPKSTEPISSNLSTCTITTLTNENNNKSACKSDSANKQYDKYSGDNNYKNNNNNNIINKINSFASSSFSTSFTTSAKMSEQEMSAQVAAKIRNDSTSAFRNSFNTQNTRPQSALETKCKSPFIVQTTAGTSPPFTFKAAPMFPCTMPSEQNNTNMLDDKMSLNRNQEQLRSSSYSSSKSQPDAEGSTETATFASLSKQTAMWKHHQETNAFQRKTALLDYSSSHNTLALKEVWKCVVCGKVKDLRGEHLRNKTSVRSDCWPCGKKQTFVLSAARSSSLVKEDNYAAGQHRTSLTANLTNTSSNAKNDAYWAHSAQSSDKVQELRHEEHKQKKKQQELECKENVSEKYIKCHANTSCLPDAEKSLVARVFVPPIIPPSANVDDYFMQPVCASSSSSSQPALCALTNLTLPHSTSAHTENNNSDNNTNTNTVCGTRQIDYHLFTRSLLIHLRTLSLTWPPRRCVWHEASNTLYVLLTEKELEEPLHDNDNYEKKNYDDGSKLCYNAAKLRSQSRVKKEGSMEMPQTSTKNDCGVWTNAAHVKRNTNDAEILGKYAAHLFAIEQMIVQSSPFKRVTHWFCDSELSFAACCCYASQTCPDMHLHCGCNKISSCKSHWNNIHQNKLDNNNLCNDADANINDYSNKNNGKECHNCHCQTYCSIYGPVPDPTRARTAFGNIIVNASTSHFPCSMLESSSPSPPPLHDVPSIQVYPTIVSEEQRIAAAQEFYRRTSWLTLPMYMNGMAIHLKESLMNNNFDNNSKTNNDQNGKNDNTINNDICCEENVSVVLVAATMKLEELAQAATWTLPPTPEREKEPTSVRNFFLNVKEEFVNN